MGNIAKTDDLDKFWINHLNLFINIDYMNQVSILFGVLLSDT